MESGQIGRYQIIEKLGEGGMGVVYKAMDISLERYVAIKVLSEETSSNLELIERFHIEAKAQARLSHTNIATVHAFEQVGSRWLIAMEYLDGESFEQMVARRGPIPSDEAVPLFRQALLGIGFAHRAGIVHRDIKPSNIMVTRSGIVKVMDFGIAKVIGGQRLTRTGTRIGTVAYMSPEQIRNLPVDIRSDIYSLGVTLYEILTAHLPFEGESDFQMMTDHCNTPPPLPTRHYPYIPAGIERAALEALAKDPDARFQTCEAFGVALEHPGDVNPLRAENRPTTPPGFVRSTPPSFTPAPFNPSPNPTPPPLPAQGGWQDQSRGTSAQKITTPQPVPRTYPEIPDAPGLPTPPPTMPPQHAAQPWTPQLPQPPQPPAWTTQTQAPQTPIPPPVYAQPEKKRRSPWFYVIIGVVGGAVILFVILVGIGLLAQWQKSRQAAETSNVYSDTGSNSSPSTDTNNTTTTTNTTVNPPPAAPSAPVFVQKQVLQPGAGDIWDTALSWNNEIMVSGDDDKTVKIWDLVANDVRTLSRQNGSIFGVAIAPDGTEVASASRDKSIITWNTADGHALMKFPGDFPMWTVAYSPDGTILAAGGDGKTISMWSLPSGKFLGSMQGTAGEINRLRFSPDGSLLAAGGDDAVVYLWSVANQSQVAALRGHAANILSVAFSPDGNRLATSDLKGVIYIWNVGSGMLTPTLSPSKELTSTDGQAVNDLVFTPDGNYLLSASADKNIGIWNASSGELLSSLSGHTDAVLSLALSKDGHMLVSSSKDGTIRLWQVAGTQ